jgi:hypothetical protein
MPLPSWSLDATTDDPLTLVGGMEAITELNCSISAASTFPSAFKSYLSHI